MTFLIYGQDNDSYAFLDYPELTSFQRIHQSILPDMSGTSIALLPRCKACGELLEKWSEPLNGLKLRKRIYDMSSTYDGIRIVSERFRAVYSEAALSGLEFRELPNDPGFYAIRPTRAVEFDVERRKTRFLKPCPNCGRFESVVGATPVCLKPGVEIAPNEFVRTDVEFASGDGKHPLILCGDHAAGVLLGAKLKGVDLTEISDNPATAP